jgi:hypothetical protein
MAAKSWQQESRIFMSTSMFGLLCSFSLASSISFSSAAAASSIVA